MEDKPYEKQNSDAEEHRPNRLLANWRSCVLLLVMLLGLLATPLAVVYRWSTDSAGNRLSMPEGQERVAGRIAYITPRGQLATMNSNGGDVRLLVDLEHGLGFPAWAPDGRHIGVTAGGKLLLVDPEQVAVSQAGLTELYTNALEPPFYLYWSPNSESISFLTSRQAGLGLRVAELDDNQSVNHIVAEGEPFYWDWEPTADGLFIHSGGSGIGARLETIDLRGATRNANFGLAGIFQTPGVSASGRFRAYAALDDAERSRLVIDEVDGQKMQFEANIGQLSLAWSPTSEILAYRSQRIGAGLDGGPLRKLDPSSGDSVLITNQNVLAFFWSPDGRTIAYFSLPLNEVDNVRVASASGKQFHRAKVGRLQVDLRLDLWVVDVASGNQRLLAQFTPTPIFMQQFLPFSDQYALSHRIWSPNSDALVIPVVDEGRSQIAVVPLTRATIQLVAEGQIGFWSYQ